MNKSLVDYILQEREKGYSDKNIKTVLIQAGYAPEIIDEHLKQKSYRTIITVSILLFVLIILIFLSGQYLEKKAEKAMLSQDYEKALKMFKIINIYKKDESTLFFIAKTDYSLHDYESSIEDYKKLIDMHPSVGQYHKGLAKAYFMNKNYDLAQKEFDETIKIQGKTEYEYSWLGWIMLKKGEYEKAISYFNKGISINPVYSDNYRGKAKAYFSIGNYTAAIENFKIAILFKPDERTYEELALANLKTKRYNESIKAFEKTIFYNSEKPRYYLGLAYSYMMLNDSRKDEAYKIYSFLNETTDERYSEYQVLQ